MRFFDCQPAPSPRRVRIFLAEKGLEVPTIEVDLASGEQFGEPFRRLNPWCTVPVLELDDGTCLTETVGICSYLEEVQPEPRLMGRDRRERALVLDWNHRIESEGLAAIAESFRNHSRGFRNRSVTGPGTYEQVPALIERGRARASRFFDELDGHLAGSPYVVDSVFTMADITALVAYDFAGWIKLDPAEGRAHLARWHKSVSARPSAKV
jgi:glutathione S-transferase